MHAYWRPRSLTCARTICALRFVIDGGRHRRAVAEPEETGHHDIAIGFELGRRHIGPCKRSEAAYAIAVKGGLRLEPLCDCRISASLRQNLIEQAAILIVQRIGSDCLDRLEHRKLAPFPGVENRVDRKSTSLNSSH